MKQLGQFLLGAVLAALLLWWVLHDKDPRRIAESLSHASLLGILAATVLNIGHNVFRALRWRALLQPVRDGVPFRPMFTAIIVGYTTTWVTPGRLGEVVRPALLSAREDIPLGPCLGSIVADRVLDGVAIVVLFALGVWITPLQGEAAAHAGQIRSTAVLLAGVVTIVLGGLMATSAMRPTIERLVADRGNLIGWAGHALLNLAGGTDALRRPRLIAPILLHSLLVWLTIGLATWIGIEASGASIPFTGVFVLLPLLALGVAVPTPGGTGGYHAAMTWGLTTLFGVPGEIAVGAGILMHLVCVVPVILLGLALLRIDRITWSDVLVAARRIKTLGARASPARGTGAIAP